MRSNRVLSSAALLLILAIASLNAQNQEPPRVTFFPQLAVGGGAAGGFSCDFFITNQGIRAVDGVILRIFDNNGAPLVVQTQDFGATSTMEFNLAAGETRVIPITGGDAVVEGYAVLQCPRLSPVRSTVVVRAQTGGVVFTQLGVPEQHPFSHFSFAAEVRPGIGTGLALVNPAPSAQDLVISLIDQAGTLQGTKILTLQSGHHLALFLDDPRLFGAGLNFTGTATVSGADHFGLLALRLENANDPQNVVLGTLAINEGAVLSPYVVDGQDVPETEPNDTAQTADVIASLPVVLSGTISDMEQDYFRFTAQQGDIITVLVEADTLPDRSELDSEIFVLDSNENVVATNDQNGLGGPLSVETYLPQFDSFLRFVVPASGTYYLRIWDYFGDTGGEAFAYRMHVRSQTP